MNATDTPKIKFNLPLSFAPSYEQIAGVARIIIPTVVAWLVAKNLVSEALSGPVTEALIVLLAAGGMSLWSAVANKATSLIAKTTALKEVHAVVTTPEIANVTFKDDPKVVTQSQVSEMLPS